jgi:hypothetical protein
VLVLGAWCLVLGTHWCFLVPGAGVRVGRWALGFLLLRCSWSALEIGVRSRRSYWLSVIEKRKGGITHCALQLQKWPLGFGLLLALYSLLLRSTAAAHIPHGLHMPHGGDLCCGNTCEPHWRAWSQCIAISSEAAIVFGAFGNVVCNSVVGGGGGAVGVLVYNPVGFGAS